MSTAGTTRARVTLPKVASERLIGHLAGEREGPVFLVSGGMHGNEPAGVHAVQRVLDSVQRNALPLRGELIGLVGNVAALAKGQRFQTRDLNRNWTDPEVRALLASDPAQDSPEDREQRELATLFLELGRSKPHPLCVLDLHSTSSVSAPFLIMADTLRNRRIAAAQPLPTILGLEELLDGTIMGFLTERGHIALAMEGGRHDAPATVDHLESALWMALVANKNLSAANVPDYHDHARRLAEAGAGLPGFLEVFQRHAVSPEDAFAMDAGFWSFQTVRRGQRLAEDARGVIHASRDALILMPLYQPQGSDGFFLAQAISPRKLRLSTWLRRLRAERLLGFFPGIARHPSRDDAWVVARAPGVERVKAILAFFGYRRCWEEDGRLVLARRRPGHKGRGRL
ncbi:MAG: hypothetical protein DHS20C15_23860 [Planctomycetota bacterium]|nr:MAG: hypothetical protein DHS20C15_23860 [Planctomycetota bacterium]